MTTLVSPARVPLVPALWAARLGPSVRVRTSGRGEAAVLLRQGPASRHARGLGGLPRVAGVVVVGVPPVGGCGVGSEPEAGVPTAAAAMTATAV
jgi:hypothetical protein